MSRPATVVKRLIVADPLGAVSSTLDRLPDPDNEADCCNPGCDEVCTWESGQRGRPKRFCSNKCRTAFFKERAKLDADLDAYTTLRREHPSSSHEVAQLDNRIARLKMRLDRYRQFDN